MIHLIRTDAGHPHFVALVQALDLELAQRDGSEHAFYAPYNTIGAIRHVVIAYEGTRALRCGAIKTLDDTAMEVKRIPMVQTLTAKTWLQLTGTKTYGNGTVVLSYDVRNSEAG